MKENSPICARLAEIVSAVTRDSGRRDDEECGDRLADDDDEQRGEDRQRRLDQAHRD
jgi:hypothetical protein